MFVQRVIGGGHQQRLIAPPIGRNAQERIAIATQGGLMGKANFDAPARAAANVLENLFFEMIGDQADALDPGLFHCAQDVIEHGAAIHWQERLGRAIHSGAHSTLQPLTQHQRGGAGIARPVGFLYGLAEQKARFAELRAGQVDFW